MAAVEPGAGREPAADEPWETTEKLHASDGDETDYFGQAISVDGDVLVVGAYGDWDPKLGYGSAYVFERRPSGWEEVAKLRTSDRAGNNFGISVAAHRETIVVGASGDDDLGRSAGAAYVFERTDEGWVETQKLTASDASDRNYFGTGVAVQDGVVLVGAWGNDNHGANSGSAYTFERGPDGVWLETQTLRGSECGDHCEFGRAVSIGDEVLFVSATNNDTEVDSVYAFERGSDDQWIEIQRITATEVGDDDYFGGQTAAQDDVLVVGDSRDDTLGVYSGVVYVFERDRSWHEVQKIVEPDGAPGAYFGASVALDGESLAIGTTRRVAYVYERGDNGLWYPVQKLIGDPVAYEDRFGWEVSTSGASLIVSAYTDADRGESAGAAYVFERFCRLSLSLDRETLTAGQQLDIQLHLEHRRLETVTVPLGISIVDQEGETVFSNVSAPYVVEFGDTLRRDLRVDLPEDLAAGHYQIVIWVDEMRQGQIWARQPFRIVR